jgi:hypothetical protein
MVSRTLGRPRHSLLGIFKRTVNKWEGGVDWIDLAQDRDD